MDEERDVGGGAYPSTRPNRRAGSKQTKLNRYQWSGHCSKGASWRIRDLFKAAPECLAAVTSRLFAVRFRPVHKRTCQTTPIVVTDVLFNSVLVQ